MDPTLSAFILDFYLNGLCNSPFCSFMKFKARVNKMNLLHFNLTLAEAMGAVAALEIDAFTVLTTFDRLGMSASSSSVLETLGAAGRPGGPSRPSTGYHT